MIDKMLFAYLPLHRAQVLLNFGRPSTWEDKNADAGYGDVSSWYAEDGLDEYGHSIYHSAECSERTGAVIPRCFQNANPDPGIDFSSWVFPAY